MTVGCGPSATTAVVLQPHLLYDAADGKIWCGVKKSRKNVGGSASGGRRRLCKPLGGLLGVPGSRDDILQRAADLGVELDEHIQFVIGAMAGIAGELGLSGEQ